MTEQLRADGPIYLYRKWHLTPYQEKRRLFRRNRTHYYLDSAFVTDATHVWDQDPVVAECAVLTELAAHVDGTQAMGPHSLNFGAWRRLSGISAEMLIEGEGNPDSLLAAALHRFRAEHVPPMKACSCGLYGYATLDAYLQRNRTHASVFGAIEVWGKFIVGTMGMRVQYARVSHLCIDPVMVSPHRLADVYGSLREQFPGIPLRISSPHTLFLEEVARGAASQWPQLCGVVPFPIGENHGPNR